MNREPGSSPGEANAQASGRRRRRVRTVRPQPEGAASAPREEARPAAPPPQGQPQQGRNRRRHKNRSQAPQQQAQPRQQQPQQQGRGRDRRRERRVRPAGREFETLRERYEEQGARHAETWWADRWLGVLNRFGWRGRIANGRRYAEEGRVVHFLVESGRIRAKVQGTRIDPYDVIISLKPLPDLDWELAVEIMSCQALYTAQLLAGEMPEDVEDVFEAAQASLFPRYKEDISAQCSCPDAANPCKHIAAVYFVMAAEFDKDPFLIFHLRGRTRDALLGMLRAARAADAQAFSVSVETLEAGSHELLRFWQAGAELEAVHLHIQPPPTPGGNARRLGRPPFWRSPADPVTRLAEVYEAIARRAREVALNEPLGVMAEV